MVIFITLRPDVVPLGAHPVLLEVGEVGAAEAESHVRQQTLKTKD